MKEELILRQQPFRSILKIVKVMSLQGKGAISGETFKVISSTGKPYKLRYCSGLLVARKIEKNVMIFQKAFPKFYGREGKFLLFEWIDGEQLGKIFNLDECFRLGQLMGEVHALDNKDKKSDVDSFFNSRFEVIKSQAIFDQSVLAKIQLTYKRLKEGLKLDLILEFDDLHSGNLIKDKKGRIYYIDEEGFNHKIKGLGLVKPFLLKGSITSPEQEKAFWKGYTQFQDNKYFSADYQKLLLFLQLLRTITTRLRTNTNYEKEKKMILAMIKS